MFTGITLFRLITASLLPVLVAVGFYQAEKKSRFGRLHNSWKQLIIGLSFGFIAILATEFGIPVDGAVLNVRNAAPLTAGLIFGWPAGILAGFVGGVERWFSAAGDYTRLACSIGTIMAGIFGQLKGVCDEFGFGDNYVAGANIAGFKKVATSMIAHGAV